MSWDVLIFRFSGTEEEFANLPADYQPPPLGDSEAVRAMLTDVWPETDWSDLSWGFYRGADYSIEFNLGTRAMVDSLGLHVRGSGDPVSSIAQLCLRHSWCAFDTSLGELIDLHKPSREGFRGWQSYAKGNLHSDESPD